MKKDLISELGFRNLTISDFLSPWKGRISEPHHFGFFITLEGSDFGPLPDDNRFYTEANPNAPIVNRKSKIVNHPCWNLL